MKKLVSAALCAIMLMACSGKKTQQPAETAQPASSLQIEWATFNMRYDNPGDSLIHKLSQESLRLRSGIVKSFPARQDLFHLSKNSTVPRLHSCTCFRV